MEIQRFEELAAPDRDPGAALSQAPEAARRLRGEQLEGALEGLLLRLIRGSSEQ